MIGMVLTLLAAIGVSAWAQTRAVGIDGRPRRCMACITAAWAARG